jgi:hypothetical protein
MPNLRIPSDKRDRAFAMIEYMEVRRHGKISRLALSVMTGLQSLVDASPRRMGQNFLRHASMPTTSCRCTRGRRD